MLYGPSNELVLTLLAESNPSLPFQLGASTTKLMRPYPYTNPVPSHIQNTQIVVVPTGDSGYRYQTELYYRRLNFRSLFCQQIPVVLAFTAADPEESPYLFSDLLPAFNEQYGLALTVADIFDQAFPAESDNYFGDGTRTCVATIRARPECLAWIGEFTVRWVDADPMLLTEFLSGFEEFT